MQVEDAPADPLTLIQTDIFALACIFKDYRAPLEEVRKALGRDSRNGIKTQANEISEKLGRPLTDAVWHVHNAHRPVS
jgi:hypothetical protein